MGNHSVIEHHASYHYIKLEEDYLAICSHGTCSPHCKALILSILEHWMNTKRDKGEGNYVHLSMPQWIAYTYMLYERNVITDCLHELLEEGLIERRQIIINYQKTFEYTLNIDAIHNRLKALPTKGAKEVQPCLRSYLVYKEKIKAARAKKKEQNATEGVGEKSPTGKGVREKSPKVGEKSPTGYVNNQPCLTSITYLPSTSRGEEVVEQTPDGASSSPPLDPVGSLEEKAGMANFSEQDWQIYPTLRAEDKIKYQSYAPEKRQVLYNWLASYDFRATINITNKVDECLDQLVLLRPSADLLKKKRIALKEEDDLKPEYKRFYKKRTPQLWDVVRDWTAVMVEEDTPQEGASESQRPASEQISPIERDQIVYFLVHHPDQIAVCEQLYPDLAARAKAELEQLALTKGAS